MDSETNVNLDAIKYIIRNTPIGHLKDSLENLKTLIGSYIFEEKAIKEELAKYEEDHFKTVNFNEDKILISKFNKDSEHFYHDQTRKIKISLLPLSDNIEVIHDLDAAELEKLNFRNILDERFTQYKNKFYKQGITATNTFHLQLSPNGNWKIYLLLSSHNLNLKNLWTGEWLSHWNIEKTSGSVFEVSGNIKVNTYYYEEGNIQFNLDKEFNSVLSSSQEDEELATSIIEFIRESENAIQISLDKLFDNLSDQYIKPLRRKLPINGCKMNWNLAQQTILNK